MSDKIKSSDLDENRQSSQQPHKNHRRRMETRFLKTGFAGWSEYEVLEYMLYAVHKQKDTSPIAHNLIMQFGSLENALRSDKQSLIQIKDVGPETARYLTSLYEFHKYLTEYNLKIPKKINLYDTQTVTYIKNLFFDKSVEHFLMICLDKNNQLIKCETLVSGTFNKADINLTLITRSVVGCGASKVIFAHNHPSGSVHPSSEDITTTNWLSQTMTLCGVEMLEHAIVADNEVVFIKKYLSEKRMQESENKSFLTKYHKKN